MLTGFRPPLPELPPVPTAPMGRHALSQLSEALLTCRRCHGWSDMRRHAKKGLARLWLHLALERGLDPRRVKGDRALEKAYLQACVRLGLGDRFELALALQEVAEMAAAQWCAAKAEQAASRASQAPLPGLDVEAEPLPFPVEPR